MSNIEYGNPYLNLKLIRLYMSQVKRIRFEILSPNSFELLKKKKVFLVQNKENFLF